MNTTTIAATPSVQTTKGMDFSWNIEKIMRFSLTGWLAQQKMFIILSRWLSKLFITKVTPREAVALTLLEVTLLAIILPNDFHPFFYLLLGLFFASSIRPLCSLCKRLAKEE